MECREADIPPRGGTVLLFWLFIQNRLGTWYRYRYRNPFSVLQEVYPSEPGSFPYNAFGHGDSPFKHTLPEGIRP
jgi:hypothetical protein